jgi:tetratricopeptide (TPR) repeat protein
MALRKDLALYYGWAGQQEKQLRLLEALDRAGQLEPRHRLVMAQVYLDRQDGRNALRLLRPIEAAGALTPEAGLMLALAYELTHRVDDALRIYRRLAQLYRSQPDLLADLGNRALWLSRTDLALTFYESALKADPDHLAALKGSAQIYAWNNSPAQAVRRFEHYNRLNPYDYEVHYQLGELYFANGRKGDAFKAYDTATRLINMVKSRRGRRTAGGTP